MIGRTKWFPIEVILRVQSLVLCFDSAITFPQIATYSISCELSPERGKCQDLFFHQ